jgi:cyclopropane-fatty-acyl-phospholipid synthase
MTVASLVESLLGTDLPVAFRAYDGSRCGPPDAKSTIVIRSPDALRRIVTAPGELGLGRAYVAGELDFEGDVFDALEIRHLAPTLRLTPQQWRETLQLVGASGLRPLPKPAEEAQLHGRRHSKARDAAAVAHHYDVSNEFYRFVLGPSMTYSCAVFETPETPLEDAQAAKYELISRKLGLEPGMRLLDVGCGWGGMLLHAAAHHGVQGVGVTVSQRQAELAEKRVADAGLADRVEVRLQDYRDVDDGPYDAVSSIGMFEHVGLSQLAVYFEHCFELLRPAGRMLNHAISRPARRAAPSRLPGNLVAMRTRFKRRSFIDRFVFPDGELHEVGSVVSAMQAQGFEVRHVESLREHYALTLRNWVRNLESHWDEAVAQSSVGRARVWRLYMAASAVNFEDGNTQVHQTLGVKPEGARSGMPLRPRFEG